MGEITAFFRKGKNKLGYGQSMQFLQQYRSNLKILHSYDDNSIILLFPTKNKDRQQKLILYFQSLPNSSELVFSYSTISDFIIPKPLKNPSKILIPPISFVKNIELLCGDNKSKK